MLNMPTNGDTLPALWQYRVATLKQYFWMKGNSCNCCDDVLTTGKFLTTSALSETSHSCSSLSLTSLQKQVGCIGCISHRVVAVVAYKLERQWLLEGMEDN